MNIKVIRTQRHFNINDITEQEITVLYALLNRDDKVLEKHLMEQKSDWNGTWLEENIVEGAIKIRDKILKALKGE